MERLLAGVYPAIYRVGVGLGGNAEAARGITRFVLRQALLRLGRFRDAEEMERWLWHHTVLTARRAQQHPPEARADALVREAHQTSPAYVAFVRALRALPFQQREAFVLHHGEALEVRPLAVAMDCSRQATEMHLAGAEKELRQIAGSHYEQMRRQMAAAYGRIEPDGQSIWPTVRSTVARSLWPRRITRLLRLILLLAILAAVAWLAWSYRDALPLGRDDGVSASQPVTGI